MNGKETPKESFEKFTGHMFLKKLKGDINSLEEYATEQKDRNYLFWQRDPLAIIITDKKMAGEKLDYMHYNLPAGRQVLYRRTGNCVKNLLNTGFHQQSFMRQGKMNSKYLLI